MCRLKSTAVTSKIDSKSVFEIAPTSSYVKQITTTTTNEKVQ